MSGCPWRNPESVSSWSENASVRSLRRGRDTSDTVGAGALNTAGATLGAPLPVAGARVGALTLPSGVIGCTCATDALMPTSPTRNVAARQVRHVARTAGTVYAGRAWLNVAS
jgi:hypothetical protein